MLEALNTRHQLLAQELKNAQTQVNSLTEQLEKAKVHFHIVNGHFNECAFHLNEAQKPTDPVPVPQPVPPINEECVDGQANEQDVEA